MIDTLKKKDIEKCAGIFFDIYKNEPFNYSWLEYKSALNYFNDIFNTPKFKGFLFYQNDILTGVCAGVVSDYFKVKKYRIAEIFIARSFQKKGAGSKFFFEIQEKLYKIGIEAIELSTDRKSDAFGFYLKNGCSILENNINMIKITST